MTEDLSQNLNKLPTPKDLHPNDSSERVPKTFRVWFEKRTLVVYCHDVTCQGNFAIFWVVHEGVRKTIWATNKEIEIQEKKDTPEHNEGFGVYLYPQWWEWDPRTLGTITEVF